MHIAMTLIGILLPVQLSDDTRALWIVKDHQNEPAMRSYAWRVLEWLATQDWQQWAQPPEVFGTSLDRPNPPPRLYFAHPAQLLPLRDLATPITFRDPRKITVSILQTVHYNAHARSHISAKGYHSYGMLDALRYDGRRFIDPFPNTAVVIKAIWWPIKRDHPVVALPVWDGAEKALRYGPENPYSIWPRIVGISPTCQRSHSIRLDAPDWWIGSKYANSVRTRCYPLNNFVEYVVDEDCGKRDSVSESLQAAFLRQYNEPCTPEDSLVLVGMHVITKQLDDWIWMTFWWHDRPRRGVFARGRPRSIKGPWEHFLMDVAFDATTPREPDGGFRIIFNPWLEGKMVDGVSSNCISCHQSAAWMIPEHAQGVRDEVRRFPQSPDANYFVGKMRTDYLWSLFDYNYLNMVEAQSQAAVQPDPLGADPPPQPDD